MLDISEQNKLDYVKELYLNLDFIKLLQKEINKKNLTDYNIDEKIESIIQGGTYLSTFTTKDKIQNGIVFLNCNRVNENQDHFIIHELNHLYELAITKEVSGWDNVKDENIIRKYELFNEIINEKIAQEISEIRVRNRIEILGNIKGNYKYSTSYQYTNYIIEEFFDIYKDEVLKSRQNNNLNMLLDKIGQNNFDDLNDLFEKHYKNFSGMKIYSLLRDIKDSKETENTRIYNDICTRRNEVIQRMKENYMSCQEKKIKSRG